MKIINLEVYYCIYGHCNTIDFMSRRVICLECNHHLLRQEYLISINNLRQVTNCD